MGNMKVLLCTVVLVALFGYGTCVRCGLYDNCNYGCCNWYTECCTREYYYMAIGVGATVGLVTIIGVVVVTVYLLKRSTRHGRVIAPPAPSLAVHSQVTATGTSGQFYSNSVAYPPPPGLPDYHPPPGTVDPPPGYSEHPLHNHGKS